MFEEEVVLQSMLLELLDKVEEQMESEFKLTFKMQIRYPPEGLKRANCRLQQDNRMMLMQPGTKPRMSLAMVGKIT